MTLGGTEAKAFYTSKGTIRVIPEILCNMGCETPRVNYPRLMGKKYRYFYSISADVDLENPGTVSTVLIEDKMSTFRLEFFFINI